MYDQYFDVADGIEILLCSLQSCDSIVNDAEAIAPDDDIRVACETYGTGPNQPEQLLYDCYVCTPRWGWGMFCHMTLLLLQEQDTSNSMDKERRKINLSRKIREYSEDLQRQVKTKEGMTFL